MKDKKLIVSVDLVIKKDGKILLGKLTEKWQENGIYEYGLPGREIEFGDNFEKTVIKNLREETGMLLRNFKIFAANNNFGFGNHYVSIGIEVEAEGNPEVKKPDDWEKWEWVDISSIPDKLFPSAELTIKSYLESRDVE